MNTICQKLKRLIIDSVGLGLFNGTNQPKSDESCAVSGGAEKPTPPDDHHYGLCSVCETAGRFSHTHHSIRESYRCSNCHASLRYREQASAIIRLLSNEESKSLKQLVKESEFKELSIYEPGISGPFRKYLSSLPNYKMSFYWEDVNQGEFRDNIQCQNLMDLTYEDSVFDLVITSDIFEHVRKPYEGFKEIHRVLKSGAYHVFTIPVQFPMPPQSHARVDTTNEKDVLLDPPRYHGNGAGGRSLVYTDYGEDLLDALKGIGLTTHAVQVSSDNTNLRKLLTFYSIKQ